VIAARARGTARSCSSRAAAAASATTRISCPGAARAPRPSFARGREEPREPPRARRGRAPAAVAGAA
jgi:hypothetical protein